MKRHSLIACIAFASFGLTGACHSQVEPQSAATAAQQHEPRIASARQAPDDYVVGPTLYTELASTRSLASATPSSSDASERVGEAAGVHVYYIVRQ